MWFLTLFAAEEIPAAMVTYLALLMLLQLGCSPAVSTLLSALLFVPWVLKPFLRAWTRRVGHYRRMLHLAELLMGLSLLAVAFAFRHGRLHVFCALMLVSLLCAWHELTAHLYYERMLRPVFQRLLTRPRMVCSQMAVIFTYGVLIFLVGTLQVYFRQVRYSWSLGCYVAAGIFLLFALHHLIWLRTPSAAPKASMASASSAAPDAFMVSAASADLQTGTSPDALASRRRTAWQGVWLLALLLLPQGLLFHARVLYLYLAHAQGGLQCTMQEIGFAQGTVGVIAFSVGIALGLWLTDHLPWHRLFWPMAVVLMLSPAVYLVMTIVPPHSLWPLCCGTMSAQLFFGLGLCICLHPISIIFGTRHRSAIGMFRIPLVAAVMILPMALSGWMVEMLGFHIYFLTATLLAPCCLLAVRLLRYDKRLIGHPANSPRC